MGFEPHQPPSKVEAVNEFTDQMRNTLEEAKSALAKAKDDMAKYYNQQQTPAPVYVPGDKVYLNAGDIHTTQPSKKLSHTALDHSQWKDMLEQMPTPWFCHHQ